MSMLCGLYFLAQRPPIPGPWPTTRLWLICNWTVGWGTHACSSTHMSGGPAHTNMCSSTHANSGPAHMHYTCSSTCSRTACVCAPGCHSHESSCTCVLAHPCVARSPSSPPPARSPSHKG